MSNPENPSLPTDSGEQPSLDRLERLTPKTAVALRTIQEIVMKKGVDIVDSPSVRENLKQELGEPGYFFDVLNEYTPHELTEADAIGRGFAYDEVIEAPDGTRVDLALKLLIPVGPKPDEKGRRMLANCWVELTDNEEVNDFTGIVIRFYSQTTKSGSNVLIEIILDLPMAIGDEKGRLSAVAMYKKLRPKIESNLENLGLLTAIDDRFEKFQQQDFDIAKYYTADFIKQDEIEFDKFNEAVKEMAEAK